MPEAGGWMRWEGRTVAARAWVRLPSGKRLDLLNPTPFDWDDRDLALGLARTYLQNDMP